MLGLGNAIPRSSALEQLYSLILDGTNDHLTTTAAFQTIHRDSFSYSLWVKFDDGVPGGDGEEYLFGSVNSSGDDKVGLKLDSSGGTLTITHAANNNDGICTTADPVFVDGQNDWKHIVITHTYNVGAADTAYVIYVNGSAVTSNTTSSITDDDHVQWTSADSIYIGGINVNGTVSSSLTTGKISDFATFSVALDSDAVSTIYNSGKPFDLNYNRGNYDNSSALQGYWKMNDGSGTTAVDSSTNSNNGTLVNGATFSTDTPDD